MKRTQKILALPLLLVFVATILLDIFSAHVWAASESQEHSIPMSQSNMAAAMSAADSTVILQEVQNVEGGCLLTESSEVSTYSAHNNEANTMITTYSGIEPTLSELNVDSVQLDKERVRVGETLEITASGAGDCIFLADVYLNNRKLARITGTGGLTFIPEEEGIYSFALEIRKSDTQSAYFFLDHAVVVSGYWELLAVSVNAEEAATGSTIVFSAVMSQEAGTQNPEGSGSALLYDYAVYKDGSLYYEVFDSSDDSLSMYLTEPGVYYCVCSVVDEYGTESNATSPTVTLATETQLNENYNTPTHSNTLPVEELVGSTSGDLRVAPGAVTINWSRQADDANYYISVSCSAMDIDLEADNYTGTSFTVPAASVCSGHEYSVALFRYNSSGNTLSRSRFKFSVTGAESLVFEDALRILVPKREPGKECYVKYDDLTVQWTKMNYASAIEIRLKYSCGINMHEVLLTTVDGKNDTYTIPKSFLVNGAYHELRIKAYDELGNTSSKTLYFYVGEEGTFEEFDIDATTLTSTFLSDGSDRSAIPTYPAYEPIRLNWLDVPSASYFSVHIFDYDNNRLETTYDHINVPVFEIDPTTLVSGHRYYVTVCAHHTEDCYTDSDEGWFRAPYVGSLRLDPPKLTSMELSTDSSDPTIMTLRPLSLVWEPESAAVSYLVSLYMDDEETPDFEQTGITENQVTIPQDNLWTNELYELNIAAVDSAGNSAFSVFYLKFVKNNLSSPSLLTPGLSTDRNVFPICSLSNMPVTWSEVADAAGYRFQLFDYYMGDWDKILDAEQITDTTYTIPKNKLYMGGKFKFRIKAVDAYGNGKWSETYYFRVGAAGYISLSATEQSVSADAGRKAFFVTSGEGWTAASSASWLSISEASGAGSQQVSVIYAENTGEFPRTASITFTNSDGGTAVYTVTQEGQSSQNAGALRITSPKQGSILDYASFRATWKYNYYHAYYQVSLKDTVTGALVHTENNIITSYADIPIGALIYGHAYRLTVGVYDAQGNRISEGSVVFAIDGFDTQTFIEAEDQPVIAGSSNPEGNTEICYSGITDGAAVEQDNILVTWENVIDADHYWVALRDLTLYPDSIPSEEVERIINTRVDLLKMCIIAGQLTPGHDYRLWIAANRSDGSLIDGKNICFSVIPADGVAFRDLSATADGESIRWSGSVSVENDTILAATVSITTPTLPDGSFDTGYFRVTEVNAASFDYASIHSGAVATGGVVACTDENGVAKSLSLELPGEYIVAFHVYTEGGIYHQEQRRVTVGSGDMKPVLGGFSHTASVALGGPVYLSGTISAADGGTLQRVTVKCNNAGGSENTAATVAVGAASLDLSTLSFSTAEFPEIFTGPGTYEFVLYAAADNYTVTDNAITTFTVMVTEAYITPTVVILPVTINSSSSATLQAQVTDTGGGIIRDFGFNLYWTEDSTERYDQYAASSNDPYYKNGVTYDSATGIITCRLEDYSPDSTAFAEAFATYYRGELPITGFSAERAGFTTDAGDIGLSDPKSYSVFSNGQVAVSGTINDRETGVSVSELTIHIYNYQHILEEDFPCAVVNGAFSTTRDLTDWYAGSYTMQATATAEGSEKKLRSEEVPFTIPGKLRIDLEIPDETDIGAAAARVSAVIGDTQGKRIEYYGFRILDADGNLLRTLQNSYDPKDKTSITYDESSHVISGIIDALPGTSFYYEAFATYKEKGVQIESFSGREQLTMKRLDIEFSRINNSKTDNYMLDRESVALQGSIGNIADGATYGTPIFIIADQNGSEIERKNADLSGNNVSCELDLSEYPVGKEYLIHAEIEDDQGRVSYSVEKIITIPKPASSITFKTNLGGEPLPASEEHLLALYKWMVVDIDIDTSRSYIKSIRWTSSDPEKLVIHPWNKSESSFDKARPQTCQFDGKASGDYTVTVTVTNHDGSTVTSSLMIRVRPVTILQFLDYEDSMKPISGISVLIDRLLYTTDDQGYILLTDMTNTTVRSVEVLQNSTPYLFDNGLHTLYPGKINTLFAYNSSVDVFGVRLSAGYMENGRQVILHDNIDVLSSQVTLDLKQREHNITVDLDVVTNPGRAYKCFELIQDGSVIASSKTGSFSLPLTKFKQNAKIVLRVTTADTDSTQRSRPLQIKIINSDSYDGTNSNMKFTIGDEFSIRIPDQFFPIGGHEIKLDLLDIPFSFTKEGNKLSITLGQSFKDGDSNKDNDKKLKDFVGLIESYNNTGAFGIQSWLELDRKLYEKKFAGKKGIEFFGLEPQLRVAGTIEVDLDARTASAILLICASIQGGRDFPTPLAFVVTNFSFNAGVGTKFTSKMSFEELEPLSWTEIVLSLIKHCCDNIELTTSGYISVGVGVGMVGVANVTINGGFGVDGTVNFSTGFYKYEFPMDVFIRAKLLSFEYRWDLRGTTLRFTDGELATNTKSRSISAMTADDVFLAPISEYSLADRSYLSETTGWYPLEHAEPSRGQKSGTYTTTSETLMSNVYEDTQLQMVQTDSDKVMVWLTDDPVRNAVNRTKLVYSVFDENTGLWSAPQSVLDDGTLDSYSVLATDGNEIYLTWTDMKRQFAETEELESCVLASEVAAAWFNPQTKSFQRVQRLTDNSVVELDPSLTVNQGRAAVCWISNDAGDPWGSEGNNTLWVSVCEEGTWSEPTAVKTIGQMITYAQAGWLNNKLYAVCCVDSDGSFNTNDDTFVLAIDPSNGNETVLASDGLNSQVQFVRINDEDLVIWHSDQKILSVADVDSQANVLLEDVTNEYQMISDINGTVLLQVKPFESYSELYASVFDPNSNLWGNPIRMTYLENGYINDFAAVIEDNGELTSIYTAEIDGRADIRCSRLEYVKDISLDYVDIDDSMLVPGQLAELTVEVSNHGFEQVDSLMLRMFKDGVLLSEALAEEEIASGESKLFSVPITIPEDEGVAEYEIVAELLDGNEINYSNNVQVLQFGYGDLSLESTELYCDEAQLFTFLIQNLSGYPDLASIQVFQRDSGDLLDTIDLGIIGGKSQTTTTYLVEDLETPLRFCLVSSREEPYTNDNTTYYIPRESSEYAVSELDGVSIDQQTDTFIVVSGQVTGVTEDVSVICASYNASGKQLDVAIPEIMDDGSFACSLSAGSVSYVKVFLITEDLQPLDMQRIDLS